MKSWIRFLTMGFLLSLASAASAATGSILFFTCSPGQFLAGASATCGVTLQSAAPAGGTLITFSVTGSGMSIPASVTVPAGLSGTHVTLSAAASAPTQTVTITATSANTMTATLNVYHDFQIISFFCTPAVVIPGGSANCTVSMPAEAPTGGWVASLASSSPNLTVPATFNIQPRVSIFQFSATASANASVAENVTVSVTVQGAHSSTVVGINPAATFYLRGNAQEVPSLTNGTVIHPTVVPAGLTGTLTVRGTGSATIEPVGNGTGLAFHPSSLDTTTNAAFINFSGAAIGQIFGTQGEITFRLKSAYNFAQRRLLPNNGLRYAFVVDGQFALITSAGGGRLSVQDTVRGVSSSGQLPAGQEDALFGAGVTATVRIVWSVTAGGLTTRTMYWNGQVLETSGGAPGADYSWTSQSAFAIGGSTVRQLGGGAYASDDAISEFKVISTGFVAPPANHAPVALDQSVTTPEDTAKTITLTGTDADGDALTYTQASAPSHGSLSGTGASLTYTPAANYNGPDSFTFTANDGQLPSSPATISLTVTSVNDKPVAAFSANPTSGNVPLPVDFDAAASSDIDGTIATYAWVFGDGQTGTGVSPSHTFTTAGNYSVRLTVTDNQGGTATTQHSITVSVAPNTPPVAQNQSVAVVEDTDKAITLVAIDSDPLTYEIVTQPAHGTFTGTGANLIYHPTANYNGPDSFTFRANDGHSDSNDATVSITVSAVNDAPVALDQSVTTLEDTAKAITLTATDVDGDALTYSQASAPSHGSLSGTGASLTYTPAANYNGLDSFTFIANDGPLPSSPATISLTVTSVNDKPVAAFSANPTSGNVPLPVDFDAAASSDIDGTIATYAWVFGDGQTGTGVSPSHTFTTAGNYSVRLTITDNQGGTATTQHSIAAGVAPNTPPVAQNQSVAAVEDTAKAITLVAIDSDPLTYEIVTQPAHGTFTGTGANLIYHPTANYNGPDSFTFRANDGHSDSNDATVSITVSAVNDAPVALDQSVTTLEDTAKAITLTATDVDGDALTYSQASAPSHGSLSGTGASLTYTPAANYNGLDSFTFIANDGPLPSSPATISLTVTSVNDKPVAAFSANPTSGNVPLPVDFDAAASSDIDGTIATYAWVFGDGQTGTGVSPSHTFTTAGNYSVRLTVTDNQGGTATTQHSITVSVAPNTPPVAQNQSVAVVEDTDKAITLVAIDSDPLTYEIVTQPAHGSFTGTGANLIYHPVANYNGLDSFIFRANDGNSDSNDATVSITVSAVNDAPVASFSAAPASGAAPLTVFLDGSGSTDVENGALSYAWDFGDGLTGTGAAVEHTYGAGHFIASLVVTDNQGASDQATRIIIASNASVEQNDVAAPSIPHGLRRLK